MDPAPSLGHRRCARQGEQSRSGAEGERGHDGPGGHRRSGGERVQLHAWVKPQGRKKVALPANAAPAVLRAGTSPVSPSRSPMTAGIVGDQPASRGESSVSRRPTSSMATATMTITATTAGCGIAVRPPRAPSAAPSRPKPPMRPAWKGQVDPPRRDPAHGAVCGGASGGGTGRHREDDATDHGHAGGHPSGQAQRKDEEEAAGAEVSEPCGQVTDSDDPAPAGTPGPGSSSPRPPG